MAGSSLLNRWRNERLLEARPIKASVELTYRCNERCTHCYLENYRDDPGRRLSKEDWFRILAELKTGGVLYLDLMGGEAMLFEHFWELLAESRRLGFVTSMITNGLRIQDEETALRLKREGLVHATLSLYARDPEIHDAMTAVKGSHAKTLRAVRLLKAAGVGVSLNCLLTRSNIDSFFELKDWAEAEGIKLIPDPNVTPRMNGDPAPLKYRAGADQLRRYYREAARRSGGLRLPSEPAAEDYACGAGKLKCAVSVYGELLTCLDIRRPLGLLHREGFETLWNSAEALKWRNLRQRDLGGSCGARCEHCPGAALQETGDARTPVPFSEELSRIKGEVAEEWKRISAGERNQEQL